MQGGDRPGMAEFAGAVRGSGQRGSPQLPEAKERRGQALGEAGSLIPHTLQGRWSSDGPETAKPLVLLGAGSNDAE